MKDLSEFQQLAVGFALRRLMTAETFDGKAFRHLADTLGCGLHVTGRDGQVLQALDGVKWADMGPELEKATRAKVCEVLDVPQIDDVPTKRAKKGTT